MWHEFLAHGRKNTPYAPKFIVISKIEKNEILLETKDDQVLYLYKNVLAKNDSHGLEGKKKIMTNITLIVHGSQDTMIVIPLWNIFI